jgi:hypothetical protein
MKVILETCLAHTQFDIYVFIKENIMVRQRKLNYVSPSNDGRHIVLVLFFLPLLLLLLSEACPDHNFFVFPDKSIIFGMWVHDHKVVCHVP